MATRETNSRTYNYKHRYDPWTEDEEITRICHESTKQWDKDIKSLQKYNHRILNNQHIKKTDFPMCYGYQQKRVIARLLRAKHLKMNIIRKYFNNERPLINFLYQLHDIKIIKFDENKAWINPKFPNKKIGKKFYQQVTT